MHGNLKPKVTRQRRIFIFEAQGYFKLGALLEGRGGRGHISRHRFRSCSKILNPGLKKYQFEIPTPVQTLDTIDATEIHQCFDLRNDMHKQAHADSCYCRK